MKRILCLIALTSTLAAGAASAATYQFTGTANNSPLHNTVINGSTLMISNWMSTTLTANNTGTSTLSGQVRASDSKTYNINMTLTDTYFVGATQYWGNFSGSFTGNGLNLSLNDITPLRQTTTDACLGLNCTPYNNGLTGGNTAVMEFGFWGDNSPLAGGTRNSDVNAHVRCTSGTGASGPANANGTCTTGTGQVPLPGTVALLGLGLLAFTARRRAA